MWYLEGEAMLNQQSDPLVKSTQLEKHARVFGVLPHNDAMIPNKLCNW
jgi:hypothetical protein